MHLRKLFKLSWLFLLPLSQGCSGAPVKEFMRLDNCRIRQIALSTQDESTTWIFSCVDISGRIYQMLLASDDAQNLVCFKAEQFKLYNETCHQ